MRKNHWVRLANRIRIRNKIATSKVAKNKFANLTLNDLKGTARQYDTLARAQYVAGVLGDSQNAVRNPVNYLGSSDVLRRLSELSDNSNIIGEWTGRRNKDFLGQAANSIYKVLGGDEMSAITSEDVLTAVVTGISPISGNPVFGGNPLPYKLGTESNGRLYPIGSTANEVGKRSYLLANDVRKSIKRKMETSGDALVETDGRQQTLMDTLSEELYSGSGAMEDLLFTGDNLQKISRCVRSKIRNKFTQEIWDVIVYSNGDVLKAGKGGVGVTVKPLETANLFPVVHGRDVDPNSIGRNYRKFGEQVNEAIAECFTTDEVARSIQWDQDFKEFLKEERRRRASLNRIANKGVELEEGREEVICDSETMNCEGVLRFKRGGKPIPTSNMLRGFIIGIAIAQNDIEIVKKYGFDVMDRLDRVIRGWLRTAEKDPEFTLSAGQKKWLNGSLGGKTPRGLSETIRKAVIRECSLVGGCDLPDQSQFRFGQLAKKFASIRSKS